MDTIWVIKGSIIPELIINRWIAARLAPRRGSGERRRFRVPGVESPGQSLGKDSYKPLRSYKYNTHNIL